MAVEKNYPGVEFFNYHGIKVLTTAYKAKYMETHSVEGKINWYMDQGLGSDLIAKYLNKYGWNRVHGRHPREDEQGRVDRAHLTANRWYELVGYTRDLKKLT